MSGSRRLPAGRPPDDGVVTEEGGAGTTDPAATATGTTNPTTMRRSQVRGSALLVLGQVFSLMLTTATQVVIVRALTKTEFGAFGYALAIASAARILLSLGQGRLLSRFMAKYEEERDYDRMFGSVVLAVGTIFVTSVTGLAVVLLLPDELLASAVSDPATVDVVLILVLLAPIEALDQVFVSFFAVFSKPRTIFFRKYLFTPGLRLGVVLTLALTGSSLTFLAVGYVATGAIGLAVYMTVAVRVLRERDLLRHLHWRSIVLPYRAVFSFSLPLITGEFLLLSLTVGGVLILGYYHSAAEVASYRAVFNPARLNSTVMHAFVPLFLPLAARLFARGDMDGLRRAYWHTGAVVAVLTFPIFALTGPLATDLTILLFGAGYADSGPVLAVLSVGYYFSVVLGFNAYALQICERIRFLVGVNLLVAALNVGLSLWLGQRYGAIGVATANLIALVVQNLVTQWALRRAIRTSWIDRSCLLCYGGILACAAALWAFQALVEPGLLIGLVAAAVASFVVLLVSRSAMELGDTFPELRRVPVVGRLVR